MAAALRGTEMGRRVCLVQKEFPGDPRHEYFLRMGLLGNLPVVAPGGDPGSAMRSWVQDLEASRRATAEKQTRRLEQLGVSVKSGEGSLIGSRSVKIRTEGGEETAGATGIVLAMGSDPVPPTNLPFDPPLILPFDDLFTPESVPPTLLVLGGGRLALEVATLFNRLGSRVFLCVETPRLLNEDEPVLTDLLEEGMKKSKIKLLLNKRLVSHYKNEGNIDITLDGGVKFSVERIVWTGPRQPRFSKAGAQSVGLRVGERGEIWVNENLQTSLPGVYAAGSLLGRSSFRGISPEEGRAAAENALGKKRGFDPDWVPQTIFTAPQIAFIGCTAEKAHHKGFRAVMGEFTRESPESSVPGRSPSWFKVVADRETRCVIGGQVVSPRASEMISLLSLAVRKGMKVNSLATLPCEVGSESDGIREAAKACLGRLKSPSAGS